MESKIIEFPETLADLAYRDEHGSVHEAQQDVMEVIDSLNLHVGSHNMLVRSVARCCQVCEKAARDAAKEEC